MYCESCGKKLIRGYQFCIECGTPVPPEADENAEENAAEGAENGSENTAENGSVSMPDIQPISGGEGSLVFCSTCGMHMQNSTTVCEKCGKPLANNGMNNNANSMPNGGVPLFNNNPLGDDFSEMSEGDIDQLNSFMNGGGLSPLGGMNGMNGADGGLSAVSNTSSGDMGSIGGSDIESLAQQLASFGASTSEMPAIGVTPPPVQMRQAEPKPGEAREVQDFAMDSSADVSDFSSRELPVIDVGSMDENPAADVSLDPYSFVNNVIETSGPAPAVAAEPAPAEPSVEDMLSSLHNVYSAPAAEDSAAAVEDAAPVFEPAPAVEGVAPAFEPAPAVEETAPAFEPAPAVEEVAPAFEPAPAVEEVAPAFEPAPAAEETAPAFEPTPAAEEVAPAFEPAPAAEDTAPAFEPAPAVEDTAPAFEPAPFIEEGAPFIEEGAPVIAEGGDFSAQPTPAPAPAPAPLPRPAKKTEQIDPALGKLSYCRNCGQDMYENEPVCKNCGAPYKPPVKHDKSLDKKTGSVPADENTGIKKYLPIILGVSAVAAVIIILIVATPKSKKPNNSITGSETLSVTTTTAATTTAAPPDTEPADTSAPVIDEPTAAAVESAEPAPAETVEGDTTPANPEKPETSDAAESTPATHRTVPHTTPSAPPTNATTPKATTPRTTPAAPVTTTAAKPAAAITSSKTISLEADRDAIMDAVAAISGEVGKIDSLAQNIIYAMENSTGNAETARTAYMNRDYAKNMLSSLDSGKSNVDSAVTKAKPKNNELKSMYDSLVSLQKKYTAYYNFIKSPSGSTNKFTSSCSTYMSDFTTGVNGFKYTKFTSDYTSGETNASYKAAMSDAVTAVNNAVSSFSTLQSKVSDVDKSTFDTAAVQELSKSSNTKTLAKAIAYAQQVQAYRIMLASAPSSFSTAYDNLKSASDYLNALVDLYHNIQENSLSSYKTESSDNITNATAAAQKITNEIS